MKDNKSSGFPGHAPGHETGLPGIEIEIPEIGTASANSTREGVPKGTPKALSQIRTQPSAAPLYEYEPRLPLIEKVSVFRWGTEYRYYDSFLEAAERLKSLVSDRSEYTPFFSYMPQYSQLNAEQLGYYLCLRSEITEGRFPEADYGYLLLLIYESINLAGVYDDHDRGIPPETALDMLLNIWRGYRNIHPRLDGQLSEWVCDFCLIHRMRPPLDAIRPFVRDAVKSASLKEFYAEPEGDGFIPFLTDHVSGYDYRKSRFASDAGAGALFDRHIPAMLDYVSASGEGQGSLLGRLDPRTVSRDAFVGALSVPAVKKKITVIYKSFTASFETKMAVTALIKYGENRLRSALGIKSRMSVTGLPDRLKRLADSYFKEVNLISEQHRTAAASGPAVPEWEKYYEPEKTEMSFERAREIEQSSWETTEKLISAFGDGLQEGGASPEAAELPAEAEGGSAPAPVPGRMPDGDAPKEDPSAGTAATELSGDQAGSEETGSAGVPSAPWPETYAGFVSALLKNDRKAAAAEAKRLGRPAAIIAEEINSAAYELFGDILIEETDGGFAIIPDYAEEAARLAGEA